MRNIRILLISDIHLKIAREEENQDLVISEFFKDLSNVLKDVPMCDRFCIILGDLVQVGGLQQSYNEFEKRFLTPLMKFIEQKNIYCIPGNHDLNRNYVENHRSDYDKWLQWEGDEKGFNDTIASNDNYFCGAFDYYVKFKEKCLISYDQNLFGYSINLIPEISVMFLNSAILSNGGLNEKNLIPPFPVDKANLKIETSQLFDWRNNNDGRTKILVMHHPVSDLTEFAQRQLDAIINDSVDIQINGHTHFQKCFTILQNGRFVHSLTSPQLFSNKQDETNGYSLLFFQ